MRIFHRVQLMMVDVTVFGSFIERGITFVLIVDPLFSSSYFCCAEAIIPRLFQLLRYIYIYITNCHGIKY